MRQEKAARAAEANADALQIGIIQTQAHVALDRAREGFEAGLEEAGYTVGEDVVIDYQNAQGDQSNLNTITNQFASDKKDPCLRHRYTGSCADGQRQL